MNSPFPIVTISCDADIDTAMNYLYNGHGVAIQMDNGLDMKEYHRLFEIFASMQIELTKSRELKKSA